MLRKTNYTRDSLKRTDKEQGDDNDPSVVYQIKNKRRPEATIAETNEDGVNNNNRQSYQNRENNNEDAKTNEKRSKFKRQSSLEAIKAMLSMNPGQQAASQSDLIPTKEARENGQLTTKEKIELSPGVVLYAGETADL